LPRRRHHVVHVHADFLIVAFLEAVLRGDGVDEHIADRGAGLVCDLLAAQLLDGRDAEVLARHHLGGAADELDLGDGDEPALVGTEDHRLAGIGAEVHLPRHHLLHGEIAGRNGEFLELDAVLLEEARAHQVIGRHAPDVGLVALADGRERERRSGERGGRGGGTGGGEAMAAGQSGRSSSHRVLPSRCHCPA
jgi:hypothetical protein